METEIFSPGDPRLDTSAIPPYTNVWHVTREGADGGEIALGTWEDQVEFETRDGRRVLRRIQRSIRVNGAIGTHLDEVDAVTLEPIRMTQTESGWPRVDLTYTKRRLTGTDVWKVADAGDGPPIPVRIEIEFPEPVFEWHLWGVLLAAFPLADGFSARFLAHNAGDPDAPRLRMFNFRVSGRETIDLGALGRVECFVTHIDDGEAWTLWISATRRPRPVIQLKIESPNQTRWFRPAPQTAWNLPTFGRRAYPVSFAKSRRSLPL